MLFRSTGSIRYYDWGSTTALAALRGVEGSGRPEAELWFDDRPGLPFLVKVLAVDRPLSLQIHPDSEAAQVGFAAEEAAGLPSDDPRRSFRDNRAKPELACALSPFEVLCGFRPVEEALEVMAGLNLPASLGAELAAQGPAGWPAVVRDALAGSSVGAADELARICRAVDGGPWSGTAALVARLADLYPGDPALLLVPLLGHHRLEPGDAVSVAAGVPHAYLSGMAVEVMPPGDNVVRGGLTSKHVDGIGLADVVDPTARPVAVQRPDGPVHSYDGPTDRILVRRVAEARFAVEQSDGPHLVLGTAGTTTVRATGQVVLGSGEAVEVPVGRGSCTLAVAGEAYLVTGVP